MKKEFLNLIKENIGKYLPNDMKYISMEQIVKMNDVSKWGILIRENPEESAPIIYLEEYEDQYDSGKPLEVILQQIADVRVENRVSIQPVNFESYEQVKPMLITCLCEAECNYKFLKQHPHIGRNGMEIYCRIVFEKGVSASVSYDMIKKWGISEEQLILDAFKEEENQGYYMSTMESLFGTQEKFPFYVASNKNMYYGASAMIHINFLRHIRNTVAGGADFYIIPSSVHELLFMFDLNLQSADDMRRIIYEVNRTCVEPEEILSDRLFLFDGELKEV